MTGAAQRAGRVAQRHALVRCLVLALLSVATWLGGASGRSSAMPQVCSEHRLEGASRGAVYRCSGGVSSGGDQITADGTDDFAAGGPEALLASSSAWAPMTRAALPGRELHAPSDVPQDAELSSAELRGEKEDAPTDFPVGGLLEVAMAPFPSFDERIFRRGAVFDPTAELLKTSLPRAPPTRV